MRADMGLAFGRVQTESPGLHFLVWSFLAPSPIHNKNIPILIRTKIILVNHLKLQIVLMRNIQFISLTVLGNKAINFIGI